MFLNIPLTPFSPELSDSYFAIRQNYQIPNVSMSENTELRNETENLIQHAVNDLVSLPC